MFLFKLAMRNLRRHTRRTVVTATVIVAGIGLLILGEAFITGVEENIVVSAEDGMVGHLVARPADYPTQGMQLPVDELLDIGSETRAFLDENTVAWTSRTLFAPTAIAASDHLRVRAIGYDPVRDEHVFPRTRWKVDGAFPAAAADSVLVSRNLGKLLDVKAGDRLVLQVRTHLGAINALDVGVAGVLSSGNTTLDSLTILVPQALASRLIGSDKPSHVGVRLRSRELAEAFGLKLGAQLGTQAQIHTWYDETAELLRLQGMRRQALNFIVLILLTLAGFSMANTILMAAHERVREIGTLRAMGMTRTGVLGMFLIEGAVMGLIGSLFGAIWGGGLAYYWQRNPIDMSEILEVQSGGNFTLSSLVWTRFELDFVIGAVVFGVFIAVIASIFPARVASRMAPAEAVRAA